MRLKIGASLNPGGFSDVDIVGVQVDLALPELADFRAGEALSVDDIERLGARFESGLEEVRGKVDSDLALLAELARARESGVTKGNAAEGAVG